MSPAPQQTVDLIGPLNEFEQKYVPKALYVAGDISLLTRHPRVSIVGSRKASPEGVRRAHKLATLLAKDGVVVVSGLAKGIDTAAHKGAVSAGGRTIAVLGTPLNKYYPSENKDLQDFIAKHHLLVSEFESTQRVQPWFFTKRNRTMALISDASVIVEAGETSGTLSQGRENLRLGRPLFILKSVVDSSLEWPAQMIEQGARVLSEVEDLLPLLPNPEHSSDAAPF